MCQRRQRVVAKTQDSLLFLPACHWEALSLYSCQETCGHAIISSARRVRVFISVPKPEQKKSLHLSSSFLSFFCAPCMHERETAECDKRQIIHLYCQTHAVFVWRGMMDRRLTLCCDTAKTDLRRRHSERSPPYRLLSSQTRYLVLKPKPVRTATDFTSHHFRTRTMFKWILCIKWMQMKENDTFN